MHFGIWGHATTHNFATWLLTRKHSMHAHKHNITWVMVTHKYTQLSYVAAHTQAQHAHAQAHYHMSNGCTQLHTTWHQVLHGCSQDVLWLERDFHLYLVHVFDTEQAAMVRILHRIYFSCPCIWHRISCYGAYFTPNIFLLSTYLTPNKLPWCVIWLAM